jgi:hypothetical protein
MASDAGTYSTSAVGIIMCTGFIIYAIKLYQLLSKANKASPVAKNTLLAGVLFALCFIGESVVSVISAALPDVFDSNSEYMIGVYYSFNLLGLCVLLYLFKNGVSKLNPNFGKSSRDLSSTGSSKSTRPRKGTETINASSAEDIRTSSGSPGSKTGKKSWWGSKDASAASANQASSSDLHSVGAGRKHKRHETEDFGAASVASTKDLTISTSDVELAAIPVSTVVPKWGEIGAVSPRDRANTENPLESPPGSPLASPLTDDRNLLQSRMKITSSDSDSIVSRMQIEAGVKKAEVQPAIDITQLKIEAGVEKKAD